MAEAPVDPDQIRRWLERMKAGDKTARDEMLQSVYGRLESLARKMLRRFPNVRPLAQTDDVLQSSLIRLLRALQEMDPASVRDFFGLAAAQMRWVLLDLARQVRSRRDLRASYSQRLQPDDSQVLAADPADEPADPEDLEKWCNFHQAVEQLPAEEREVVSLIYYHGWSQAAVAELFGITERTVRRRWTSAMQKLQHIFQGGDDPHS